ncbi:hypothetical protein, partial [Streptomyces albidoflavus]|uniref:hypothetical protein n=2 Tax=Streptomyces albidoflavus TaxID=1886 RepID=UPI003CFA6D44
AVLKQRPTTRHNPPKQTYTGAGNRRNSHIVAAPSDTQQRARHPQPLELFSTPKQYSQSKQTDSAE